jgi:hypothetical protein
MLKLVVITANYRDQESDITSLLESLNKESPHYIVTHAYSQPYSSSILGNLDRATIIPVNDLIRLLMMHPSFGNSSGLLDFIYADMLNLIGLDPARVARIAGAFSRSDLMIVTVSESLQPSSLHSTSLEQTGSFEIRLHSNCRALIKKAMVNLVNMPSQKWERQVAL